MNGQLSEILSLSNIRDVDNEYGDWVDNALLFSLWFGGDTT